MESNEERRSQYLESIKDIPKEDFVYIDESGIEMSVCKDRGWGRKGEILNGKKSSRYYERINIIAGLVNNKSIAPLVFNGSYNTKLGLGRTVFNKRIKTWSNCNYG